jgi:hypothetical protein
VPAIDPAPWVADLGIAAVWAEQDGAPDAPRVLPRLDDGERDIDGHYAMSAPDADLVGDLDGFNVFTVLSALIPGASLSAALVAYYVDGDGPGLYRQRWRLFANTMFGTSEPLGEDLSAGEATWTPRVDRFNDLFAAEAIDALLTSPTRGSVHPWGDRDVPPDDLRPAPDREGPLRLTWAHLPMSSCACPRATPMPLPRACSDLASTSIENGMSL